MKTLYTLLLLLCCCLYAPGQQVKRPQLLADTTIYMLTYGLPAKNTHGLYDSVAAKYGFQYLWVGGCIVDRETSCCVSRLNEITISYLKLVNGDDWEERFERDVSAYRRLCDSALAIAARMPYIIRKQKEQEELGFTLAFEPRFTDNRQVCMVDVFGWDNKQGIVRLCKLEINAYEQKVKIISDKPTPCYYCPSISAI